MNLRSTFALVALVALAAGCQSTTIRSAWFDTNFTGPPMRKIVVAGRVDSTVTSRVFEDAFAERLRAAAVDAVAGHTIRLNDAGLSEAAIAAAVANTGAQGLLLVTLLGVDTRTQVTTTMVSGGMDWGWGPWGGGPTRTMVPVQEIRQYDLATVETKLFDVKTKQLVWAATTSTFSPGTVARETPGFADLIIGQLSERGVIARK
jgi:hypothetical protein